jgi:hypothetical protein
MRPFVPENECAPPAGAFDAAKSGEVMLPKGAARFTS